jgi:hypothetical protein
MLYRDDYGVPIPSPVTPVTDPETGEEVNGGLCWQPIAFNVGTDECPTECVVDTTTPATVAVNQYSCGVEVGCSGCTQEVDFGRMNSARAPDSVFESQLADVVVNLATADCVSLDPAGRLVTSREETVVDEFGEIVVDDEGEEVTVVISGAIDSPLQNMAIYKELMLTGEAGFLGDDVLEGLLPGGASVLDTAARGLGAGSGKTGEVNVDLVAYLNQIMGLTDKATTTILDPKICETYREEVQGNMELVEKCFLNYGAGGSQYGYARSANFSALPAPPYVPAASGGAGQPGYFEVLEPLALTPDPFDQTFGIYRGPTFTRAFQGLDAGSSGNYGIDDFAQAADDARAVINYMHSWPLPVDYATPLVCEASDDIAYEVSIGEESGLQVPKNIVDGSSDREFIVNVANAGPDDAIVTLTVTAIPVVGGTVLANLDGDEPDAGFIASPFVFPPTVITAGGSHAFSALISVDIGQRTTIEWEATVAAEFDVIESNNTQTAISTVRTTSGRGGGEGE